MGEETMETGNGKASESSSVGSSGAVQSFEIVIHQIADDAVLRQNRDDGTGWDWAWADYQRDWMDATPSRFAYRCLPLTMANQTGLWVKNPVGFTAIWRGSERPNSIEFAFDVAGDIWGAWITNEFGAGIITWNTPYLFRTRPPGSRLLVSGPANQFKDNLHPLTAILETDWMTMSFTMNWKVMRPGQPVRFEAGEPLFQAIPLSTNLCADIERAKVAYKRLSDDPELTRAYGEWDESRKGFMQRSKAGQVAPDAWQKDYFYGRDAMGNTAFPSHMNKLKPPDVVYGGTTVAPASSSDVRRISRDTSKKQGENVATHTSVTNEWRRWIAENLMLGASRESILQTMIASGLATESAATEIDQALASPYVWGVERLRNRLKKRDWLLGVYRKLSRLDSKNRVIPRRHKITRDEFIDHHYCTNRPVIITGMMEDWPALSKWSLEYFDKTFGDRMVEVQIGRERSKNFEQEREKFRRKMRFSDYIAQVRAAGTTNNFYITANNNSANKEALPELWNDIVTIAEYLDNRSPANGFFWFGPAGTITPFHHDLTNNMMAQVMGRKRVLIAPSWDMPLMRNLRDVYCEVDGRTMHHNPDASPGEPQILECCLAPGEILFLPIGSLHFVEALDVSATVSFTNFAFDDNDFANFYDSKGIV